MKRFVSSLFLGLILLCLSGRTFAGPAPPAGSPTPTPPKFNIPIPPGHGAEGVNLPYYDDHGNLQMFYSIIKATRIDENHMTLKGADIQTYDEHGNPETNILMPRSTLDLNTRIVTSDVPVYIQRADLRLTGDSMTFDTVKHRGKMTGHIRMVLYNNQSKAAASPAPASAPSPSPAAAAAPTAP